MTAIWKDDAQRLTTHVYPVVGTSRSTRSRSTIPLGERLALGFLAREGMRKGEALSLTWGTST